MVKTVSELVSCVKNYRKKTKKQKEGSTCMHASGGRLAHGWLVGSERDGGGHVGG
jgi:hypothetical protein